MSIQQQVKAQALNFVCSACGAERGCDCNAPAIEKLARVTEQQRQASKAYRERQKAAPSYDAPVENVRESSRISRIMEAQTSDTERYTPKEYVELARKVLGTIDLDPASCEAANIIVKAARFYTKDDDGLSHPWHGKVFCNPPYCRGSISKFADKFSGVTEGIMLVIADTKTSWFQKLLKTANAVCFTKGVIRFLDADGNDCPLFYGQAFFYIGEDVEAFEETFAEIGVCLRLA